MRTWKIRPFRSMLLKQKVRRIFIVIAILYVVCLFLSFGLIYHGQMLSSASDNVKRDVINISNSLTTQIEKVNGFSCILFCNTDVVNYLKADAKAERNAYNTALDTIYDTMNAYPEVSSVYIIRNDDKFLSATQGVIYFDRQLIRSAGWRREIDEKDGGYVIRVNGDGAWVTKKAGKLITLIRNINDINTLDTIGLMTVNCSLDVLTETIEEAEVEERRFYLLDHNNELVYSNNEEGVPELVAEKKLRITTTGGFFQTDILCSYQIPDANMSILCVEHFTLWENISIELLVLILVLTAVTIVMLVILDKLLTIYITRPIKQLAHTMGSVKDGWLRRASLQTNDDEIGMLKDSYNEMLVEMNRLIEELLGKEKTMRQAEIDILQQQIKPHFLYNTIEMIASLSIDDEVERIQVYDALETLGSFYRQFLSSGEKEVPLSTEIEITKKYLKLQKLRYGDIFEDCYEIDESCLDTRLPKLTIQPIVENALYHGIRMKGEYGHIKLRVYQEKDKVFVEIRDDGIGMSKEVLLHILDENSKHFGLRRTLERVQYYYKDEKVYEIESKEGEFTRILLILRREKHVSGNDD